MPFKEKVYCGNWNYNTYCNTTRVKYFFKKYILIFNNNNHKVKNEKPENKEKFSII